MKYFLLSITTFLAFTGSSQSSDSLTKPRRWQIGVNYSADYNYRALRNNSGDESTDSENQLIESIISDQDKLDKPKFGYTTGINSSFMFSRHIGIELGLQYSNKGYRMPNIPVTTVENPENAGTADFIYNYHFIDIPLRANFTFGKKKLQFIGSAGFVTNLFIKEIDKSVIHFSDRDEESQTESDYEYKPATLSAALSAGISYRFTDRMTIRLEPTVRYGLTDIVETNPISIRLYNAGINLGYYFSF